MKNEKQIEKEITTQLKKVVKKYGCSFISNSFYKKEKEFFIHVIYFVGKIEKDLNLIFRMYIKPYAYDNIFWTNIQMEENISKRDSLRANGAFVSPSYQFGQCAIKITNIEDVCDLAIKEFENEMIIFMKSVDCSVEDFNKMILKKDGLRRGNLLKMLANIQMGNYVDAVKLAKAELEKGEGGGYQNNGKDIYEYLVLNYS